MSIFEERLWKKDKILRRRIEIDNTLYEGLQKIVEEYDTNISNLVNISIENLIKTEKVKLYERAEDEIVEAHNFSRREGFYRELEKLRAKYGISVYKLTNIAIYNALNDRI